MPCRSRSGPTQQRSRCFLAGRELEKSGACLGVFEGYSLLDGTLARAANYQRTVFLREVQITYLHELGHYFGWDEEEIANVGLA